MESVILRPASLNDLESLRDLFVEVFRQTFAHSTSAENMERYVNTNLSAGQLRGELEVPDSGYVLALQGTSLLGFAKLRTGHTPTGLEGKNAMELQRMYVHSSARGKGIAQLLMNHCLAESVRRKADVIWLGVWEENHRAKKFYLRNGFSFFGSHTFWLGEDVQTDLLMMRDLIQMQPPSPQ
jgi:ribosomal protein S18 acetylase RimI-like enzyme